MKKLFYNAVFYNMEDSTTSYKAVLCENDKVTEVFPEIPIIEDCEKVDLEGCVVFPGFIDAHTHSFEGGLYQQGAGLSQCESISDIIQLLKQTEPVNGLIFAWKLDENKIKEKKLPHRVELNNIFPKTPLLIRRVDGHTCVINDAAIELYLKNPQNQNTQFPKDGVCRGRLNDIIAHTFHKSLDSETILQCYKTAENIALKNGHTGLHTMIGDAQDDLLHFELMLEKRKDYKIDFTLYPQVLNLKSVKDTYDKITPDLKNKKIGGCLLADGSFGSFTAAVSQSYLGQQDSYGTLYQSQKFWNKFISDAHLIDLQTAVHCIGDRAIAQIVDAIEFTQKVIKKDLRHALIHCELLRDDLIKKMVKNNIYAIMQPMFDAHWGGEDGFYAKVLGKERLKYLNRIKTLIEHEIMVVGSSDWYITELSALKGINAAINHHNKNERISNFEAVKLYTVNPPYLNHEENIKGKIKKGYIADFVCLDKDILKINDITEANVVKTIKNAEVVYG